VSVALVEATCPVVACTSALLGGPDVFGVVEVLLLGAEDVVDHAGLQVEQDRARDVLIGVRLLEEDVLAVVDELVWIQQLSHRGDSVLRT